MTADRSLDHAAAPFDFGAFDATQPAPHVVLASRAGVLLNALDAQARARVERELLRSGAVLLRGFRVRSALDVRNFAESFGAPLLSYEFGSTPRRKIATHLYSSTEYPAHQSIPLHNEQSYTRSWPRRLWFYCQTPAAEGGETPLADSRKVLARIPAAVRSELVARGLLYVRHYGHELDLSWQQVFGTDDRDQVGEYCAEHGIEHEWLTPDLLRTAQRCQVTISHPQTGEEVWFNQAHLFHLSSLPELAQAGLRQTVGEALAPRNVYFGDGAPIPDPLLDSVREAYRAETFSFSWRAGDVLMIDNLLVAHGRNPYAGDRKLVVAMA
jgi:alpha-ketoglutarate-dependent taurine dioxygenase